MSVLHFMTDMGISMATSVVEGLCSRESFTVMTEAILIETDYVAEDFSTVDTIVLPIVSLMTFLQG